MILFIKITAIALVILLVSLISTYCGYDFYSTLAISGAAAVTSAFLS